MADSKRKSQHSDKRRKRRYLSDGMSSKRFVDGPGVWVSCVKGKEKQTVGELYDLFDSLSADIWPVDGAENDSDEDKSEGQAELSIEDQINTEITAFKRPRSQQIFASCQTNTPCVVFISCKAPVDPVQLVETHIRNVQLTGVTRTRYTHRLIPVSASCYAGIPELKTLCKITLEAYFAQTPGKTYTYKIELRMRNHTTLTRSAVIEALADCVPDKHKVDLTNPELFILVEIFKSVCGMSVTKDYYTLHKYNVMEIANTNGRTSKEESRITGT